MNKELAMHEGQIQELSKTSYELIKNEQGDNIGLDERFTGYEENPARLVNTIIDVDFNETVVIIGKFKKFQIEKSVLEVQQRAAETCSC